MKTLKLTFNSAAVATIDGTGGQTITLLDALSGQVGQVMDIEVTLNVKNLRKPAIPFMDMSKVNEKTPAPASNVVAMKQSTTAASDQPIVHKITEGTKIAILMQELTKTKKVRGGYEYVGITRSDLAKAMGQVENSPTAYMYSYPAKFGCPLDSEVRDDGLRYYWANVPANVSFEYVKKEA